MSGPVTTMIHIRDLRKSFGDRVAVDGVSHDVAAGETFGLLGPNGAGKTTTLHLILGLLQPDAGTVQIDGETDPTRPAVRARIGLAPQQISLHDELTATENLRFFGSLYGLSGKALRAAVDAALALAGLEDRAGDRVGRYSGGMQRRLNLAVATLHGPRVLMLDEPTAGVDPQSRNHLLERIGEIARGGTTVVYTTHYMEEAERLCDRVAIQDHGRVLACGTVAELIAEHGGDAVVEAEFDHDVDPGLLPAPPTDGRIRFETAEPLAALAGLERQGARPRRFTVQEPDLESVFLRLTGRTLRDGGAA